jgi:hypothetical protein
MKVTLRQLEMKVRHMNHSLRDTSFGLCLVRLGTTVVVMKIPRQVGGFQSRLFAGNVKEVDSYLAGFDSGRSLTRPLFPYLEPDYQDGSDV